MLGRLEWYEDERSSEMMLLEDLSQIQELEMRVLGDRRRFDTDWFQNDPFPTEEELFWI